MAFVNERFSQHDKERFCIDSILDYFNRGLSQWTADHERQMYLMCVDNGMGPDGATGDTEWIFIWEKTFLWFQIKIIDTKSQRNGPGWAHYKVTNIGEYDSSQKNRFFPARRLSEEMLTKRENIFSDLKEALTSYKGSGIFSTLTDFEITLEVELAG